MTEHDCMCRHMDIGRADPYEQAGRQAGLRIWAAIVGARSAEQSTYMIGDVCVSRHFRFVYVYKEFIEWIIEAAICERMEFPYRLVRCRTVGRQRLFFIG